MCACMRVCRGGAGRLTCALTVWDLDQSPGCCSRITLCSGTYYMLGSDRSGMGSGGAPCPCSLSCRTSSCRGRPRVREGLGGGLQSEFACCCDLGTGPVCHPPPPPHACPHHLTWPRFVKIKETARFQHAAEIATCMIKKKKSPQA